MLQDTFLQLLRRFPPDGNGLRLSDRLTTLTLRFVNGMSLDEIAQALGVPEGTVKSRLHAGIAQLRASPSLKDFFD